MVRTRIFNMERDGRRRMAAAGDKGKSIEDVKRHKRGKKHSEVPDSCESDENSGSGSEGGSDENNKYSLTGLMPASDTDSQEEGMIGSLVGSSNSEGGSDTQDERPKSKRCTEEFLGGGKRKYDDASYRSNLQTAIKDVKGLQFKKPHIREIKRTPFWFFFNAIYSTDDSKLKKRCDKDESAVKQIILSYNDIEGKFQVGRKLVGLEKRDLQLVFGVVSGKKEVPSGSRNTTQANWVVRCFQQEIARSKEKSKGKGKFILYKTYILKKISELLRRGEGRELDVARLVHCYMLAAVFAPNKNASMPSHLAWCLEDFAGICSYDWCGYIIDMLKTQICGRTSSRIGGCTILLHYWLCEHANIISPINTVAFPRFMRWNLQDLNKWLMRKSLVNIEGKNIYRYELDPANFEKDTFKSLVKYWEKESGKDSGGKCMGDHLRELPERTTPCRKSRRRSSLDDDECEMEDDDLQEEVNIGLETTPVRGAAQRNRLLLSEDPSSSRHHDSNAHVNREGISSDDRVHNLTNLKGDGIVSVGGMICGVEESRSGIGARTLDFDNTEDCRGLGDAVQFAVDYCQSAKLPKEMKSASRGEGADCSEAKMDELRGVIAEKDKLLLEKDNVIKEQTLEKEKILLEYERVVKEKETEKEKLQMLLESNIRDKEREIKNLRQEVDASILKDKEIEQLKREVDTSILKDKEIEQLKREVDALILKDKEIEQLKREVDKCMRAAKASLNDKMMAYIDAKYGKDPGVDRARYECELARKDEEILNLRTQIEEMIKPPTNTQEMESLECLAREDVDEQLDYETEEDDGMNQQVSTLEDELTPVAKKKRSARTVLENSMVKRVKKRTATSDRKAIELTPVPTTAEILDLDNVRGNERRVKRPTNLKLNGECDAVKKLAPDIKTRIQGYWAMHGPEYAVWEGDDGLNRVLLCDIVSLLHHERLSSVVIDSWGELLRDKANDMANARHTYVISGKCWDLIAPPPGQKQSVALLDLFVNGPLAVVDDKDTILIPMVAKNVPGSSARVGDHWTLLKLDLLKCEWTFLNPMRPRNSDPHLTASFLVVNYVESKLRERFKKSFPNHRLLKGPLAKPVSAVSVQQMAGSLDCGVIVSYHIENAILNKNGEEGIVSRTLGGEYRARMTEWFMNPSNVVTQ